jgi:hypothetical protein
MSTDSQLHLSLFKLQLMKDKLAECWKLPNEELIPIVAEYAQVESHEAEAFVIQWKHNHPNGALPVVRHPKARKEEGEEETFEERLVAEVKPARTVTKKEPGAGSIIDQILTLHKAGKSRAEIVAAGFNKSTVARQVGEYEKKNKK